MAALQVSLSWMYLRFSCTTRAMTTMARVAGPAALTTTTQCHPRPLIKKASPRGTTSPSPRLAMMANTRAVAAIRSNSPLMPHQPEAGLLARARAHDRPPTATPTQRQACRTRRNPCPKAGNSPTPSSATAKADAARAQAPNPRRTRPPTSTPLTFLPLLPTAAPTSVSARSTSTTAATPACPRRAQQTPSPSPWRARVAAARPPCPSPSAPAKAAASETAPAAAAERRVPSAQETWSSENWKTRPGARVSDAASPLSRGRVESRRRPGAERGALLRVLDARRVWVT